MKAGETVIVKCAECGYEFDRSVFQPYVKICPDCRKKGGLDVHGRKTENKCVTVKCEICGNEFEQSAMSHNVHCPRCKHQLQKARQRNAQKTKVHVLKCPECQQIIGEDRKLGLYVCKTCGTHWWSLGARHPNTFINKSAMEETLWENGELVGDSLKALYVISTGSGIINEICDEEKLRG